MFLQANKRHLRGGSRVRNCEKVERLNGSGSGAMHLFRHTVKPSARSTLASGPGDPCPGYHPLTVAFGPPLFHFLAKGIVVFETFSANLNGKMPRPRAALISACVCTLAGLPSIAMADCVFTQTDVQGFPYPLPKGSQPAPMSIPKSDAICPQYYESSCCSTVQVWQAVGAPGPACCCYHPPA